MVYGANVRVNQNISSINEMLHLAMPESNIDVTHGRTGRRPQRHRRFAEDAAQAEMLVKAALNPGVDVTRTARR